MDSSGALDIQLIALFEQDAVGVAITKTDTGKIVRINKKYSEIVGYSEDQLLTMSYHEISQPDDLKEDNEKLKRLVEGEFEKYSLEKRFFHQCGDVVWAKLTVYLLNKFGGEDGYHIAILEEITSQKFLEKELEEKNNLLKSVIMQSPVPTIVIKAPGRELLYVNDAALDVAGIERTQLEEQLYFNRTNVKFYSLEGKEYSLEETLIFRALQGFSIRNREAIIEGGHGRRRWISGSGKPIYNKDGEIVAALTIFPDITAQKQADEAIRESEKRYRLIMEASPDPIVQYDMEGNVLFINPAFTKLFGWTISELLGKRIPYVPEEARADTEKMIELIKKGENYSGFATRRLNKNGDEIDVVLSWGVWRDKNDKPAGSVVILRDSTKENLLKRQLIQAQKMESLGVLAGGIAHDFNNILSPIIGYSQLLQQGLKPGDKKYEQVGSILNAGKRASELANQILTFSRDTKQESTSVKPQNLLNEVLDLCRSTIPSNVTLTEKIQPDCDPIQANPAQFHQIVMNLVANACHAVGRTGGTISVQLKQMRGGKCSRIHHECDREDHILLKLADSGDGIDPSIIDNIFDPYFTTKGNKGTGLGLSIVYGIVKELGGQIFVESELGSGTTFSAIFPVIHGGQRI